MATLASSAPAALAADQIRAALADPSPASLPVLRARIDGFLAAFPNDGLVPWVRVALALSAMQAGDSALADKELARTERLPAGTAHDMWTVAKARSLRFRRNPDAALALLRPLVGKGVDPLERTLFAEELTLTALATHREYEAISYMDAWLRATTEEEKAVTIRRVSAMVEQLPRAVLLGALQAMRTQRASLGYGVDIERILLNRLIGVATSTGDAALARLLLDPSAGFTLTEQAGTALGELATSHRGISAVSGRTIGLLLPTESPALREESAAVLSGVTWALDLPRGVRHLPPRASSVEDADRRVEPTSPACAPPVETTDVEEPRASEAIRLVTRDDAGNGDRTDASLDELAGEGATVVIAGLDSDTAERTRKWGDARGIPVIILVPPNEDGDDPAATPFGFTLGERRDRVVKTLAESVPGWRTDVVAPVVDSSEVRLYPAQGGPSLGLTMGEPVSCDTPAAEAGEPRFPVALWERERTHAWLVTGSPDCAKDVAEELGRAHVVGTLGLALEAASMPPHPSGLRIVTAQAGVVPEVATQDPRAGEVHRFTMAIGALGWWAALGRDAGTLARLAVKALPTDDISEMAAIVLRRQTARDTLATATAPLWTSEANGWGGRRTMARKICARAVSDERDK